MSSSLKTDKYIRALLTIRRRSCSFIDTVVPRLWVLPDGNYGILKAVRAKFSALLSFKLA